MARNITQNYLSMISRNTIMNVEQEFIKEFCFFNIRLHEEGCSYSTELKDNDYQYFVEETIKRYLKLKEHENANKKAFKIWNGKCS